MGKEKLIKKDEIMELLDREKLSYGETATRLGITRATLFRKRGEMRIPARKPGEGRRLVGEKTRYLVEKLGLMGVSVPGIRAETELCQEYVLSILGATNCIGGPHGGRKLPSIEEVECIKKERGWSDQDVAEAFGVKKQSVQIARLREKRRLG